MSRAFSFSPQQQEPSKLSEAAGAGTGETLSGSVLGVGDGTMGLSNSILNLS